MSRLQNKVAIITGGAGGIGTAAARLFLAEGAQVLLVDLQEDALRQALDELGNPPAASYCVADVTQAADVERYARTAQERYGRVDVFFNNAGIEGVVKPLTEYPEDVFDKVLAVNVKGAWLGLKYVLPLMQPTGGSVIITSSVAGLQGSPNVAAYVTSKHAVVGLMRVAALEAAAHNIRVNTIHPAPIDNRMMRSLEEGYAPGAAAEAKKNFEQTIPLRRYGTSEEVAQLALFLASDDSRFITGSTYTVDGGLTA